MRTVRERARGVVWGVAFWVMLAGWAAAQTTSVFSAKPPYVAPDGCWPPPCGITSCDACDMPKSTCPDRCCDSILLPPRLAWYGMIDAAAFTRHGFKDFNFQSTTRPANIVLSTSDFDPDFRPMGRVLVGHTINECFKIEGQYFAVAQGESTAAVRNAQNKLFSPFGGFGAAPISGLDNNDVAQIYYASKLQNGELNILRQVPMPADRLMVSVLFGVRYVDLPEKFGYFTQSPLPTPGGSLNRIDIRTDNQMVGPQLGGLFEFYIDNRWWMNFEMKGALMTNRAKQATDYVNLNSAGVTTEFLNSEQEDHVAFAGDLALTFLYRWSPNFTTRLGYQALLLQEVALAPANFATDINVITNGPAQLDHHKGILYHGPYVGLEFGW